VDDDLKRLKDLGVEFKCGQTLGRDFTIEDLRAQGYGSILLAFGTMSGIKLNVPGEEEGLKRYYSALDFLREHLKGNQLEMGKSVVVIGGGFTAVDAVRTCIRRGAEKVYMLYRRTKDEMTAVPEEVYEAEEEGARVMYLVGPVAIEQENGNIKAIRMRNNVLGMAEKEGDRRPPEAVEGAEFTVECDTIIVAISQKLEEEAAGLGMLTTPWGTLQYDETTGATAVEDIFVSGDASMGPSTVIRSIAEGYKAAVSIDKKMSGDKAILDYLPELHGVDPEVVINRQPDYHLEPRVAVRMVPAEERKSGFDMYEETMTEEEAVTEASRCLFCGCGVGCQICENLCLVRAWGHSENFVEIDEEECVACGICIYRCPNNNIEMVSTELSPKNSSLAGKPKVVDDPAKVKIWDIKG
jgi:NADPH-dependent glutamate synthase beta subunit-like oxidoreductase